MTSNSWNIDTIGSLHIELSSICNSICPGCPRFVTHSPNVEVELSEINVDQFKMWFPESFLKKIREINFCGNFGDPMAASDIENILQYCSDVKLPKIEIRTNGGLRSSSLWENIGKIFAKNPLWVMTFSIDGLEDTNHLYRRNVSWEKIKKNVQAFNSQKGHSKWEYLIFRHNEHQINEAKTLAKEWGFSEFQSKGALGLDNGKNLKAMPATNINGEVDYWLLPPLNKDNRSFQTDDETIIYTDTRDLIGAVQKRKIPIEYGVERFIKFNIEEDAAVSNSTIKCRVLKPFTAYNGIYIDSQGLVFPCCWTGLYFRKKYKDFNNKIALSISDYQFFSKILTYGLEKIKLNNNSIEDILRNGYLNEVYANSWNCSSVETGKLAFCSKNCGTLNSLDNLMLKKSKL
jgi:MoaA/NifB/PqqE/SkfB family radical SAM enzyme